MTFSRIGIVGLGLIGGAFAKLILSYFPDTEILALDPDTTIWHLAKQDGIGMVKALSDLRDCELVIVATPISSVGETVFGLQAVLPPDAMITDVASVKKSILGAVSAHAVPGGAQFFGGHPMAGREYTGYAATSADVLRGATYVVMPDVPEIFRVWLGELGFRIVEMTPEAHDTAVAMVSHVPYLMAVLTAGQVRGAQGAKVLASSGFRDTTRVAMSPPAWGVSVCLDNAEAVLSCLTQIQLDLDTVRQAIVSGDSDTLAIYFDAAARVRQSMFLS